MSFVTRPFQTRSQSASSVSRGNPPPAASWSGEKKLAPFARRTSRTARARSDERLGVEARTGRAEQPRQMVGQVERDAPVALADAARRPPRPPRRQRPACRDRPASSAPRAPGGSRSPAPRPGGHSPAAARPRRAPRRAPRAGRAMPCQWVRKRPRTRGSTGSTACRAPGQRPAPHDGEHVHVAPLAPRAAGAERALHQSPAADERLEHRLDRATREAPDAPAASSVVNGAWVRA